MFFFQTFGADYFNFSQNQSSNSLTKTSLHMKKLIPALTLVAVLCSPAIAQDFSKIDEKARATPFPKNDDVAALATSLTTGLFTEKEKARAIYVWIAEHIRYDIKTFEDVQDRDFAKVAKRIEPAAVLKRQKGICEGYAALFGALCQSAGLTCLKVDGQTKSPKGRVEATGHAWNLVRADGEWGLVDATWGAGDVDMEARKYTKRFQDYFFFAKPESLVADHFPADPLFQLLACPVGFDFFKKNGKHPAPPCEKAADGFGQLRDSLDRHAALGPDEQKLAAAHRMLRLDPQSDDGSLALGVFLAARTEAVFLAVSKSTDPAQGKGPLDASVYEKNITSLEMAMADLKAAIVWFKKVRPGGSVGQQANGWQSACEQNLKSGQGMLKYNQKMLELVKNGKGRVRTERD